MNWKGENFNRQVLLLRNMSKSNKMNLLPAMSEEKPIYFTGRWTFSMTMSTMCIVVWVRYHKDCDFHISEK